MHWIFATAVLLLFVCHPGFRKAVLIGAGVIAVIVTIAAVTHS